MAAIARGKKEMEDTCRIIVVLRVIQRVYCSDFT